VPRRDWQIRIADIRDAAAKIVAHTAASDFAAFSSDSWTVDAVLRNLTVIGEAAANVPEDVQAKYPRIPWLDMKGMRNIVVHEYFGVDLGIIWKTVRDDVPPLLQQIESLLLEQARSKGEKSES